MSKFSSAIRHGLLLLVLVVAGYPLLWMGLTAIRTEAEAQQAPFGLPHTLYLANLKAVLLDSVFPKAYLNSAILCCLGVLCAVILAALAAFAFAQLEFPFKRLLFLLFLAGMIIPVHVTLIPLNRLLGSEFLPLKGTLWALAGPYVGFALPITILILRGAFAAVPEELLEAARIDGCGALRIFWHVALPLVRPALATVVIFNFLTMWNEFAFALTLLDPGTPTLPLAIARFKGEHDIEIARTCAALTIAVLPLLVVYCLAQKHIIRGLTAGAVKA